MREEGREVAEGRREDGGMGWMEKRRRKAGRMDSRGGRVQKREEGRGRGRVGEGGIKKNDTQMKRGGDMRREREREREKRKGSRMKEGLKTGVRRERTREDFLQFPAAGGSHSAI